jgi:hypothetical protein
MAEQEAEHAFLGKHKDKMWTYFILLALLIIIVVVVNVVWKHPEGAQNGIHEFLGLPTWALATITLVVGAIIFKLGLKVETDWPEALGAFLVAAAITAFEYTIGWNHFELGLIVVPYLIPVAVFIVMLMYAMRNSV